eukprot:2027589-Ditylum_brightwellii.AAC.1
MSLIYSTFVAHHVVVVIGFWLPRTLDVWYRGITCDARTCTSVRHPARRIYSNPGYSGNPARIGFSINMRPMLIVDHIQ